jgi:hypothetical protein
MFGKNFQDLATKSGAEITGVSKPQNADTANDTPTYDPTPLNVAGAPKLALPMDAHSLMMRLRMRFPGLPIIEVPNTVMTGVLAADVAQNVNLPSNIIAMMLFSTGPFYINFNGKAVIPLSSSNGAADFIARDSVLITPPWPFIFYMHGKQQFSVIAEQPATVQALCYTDAPKEY